MKKLQSQTIHSNRAKKQKVYLPQNFYKLKENQFSLLEKLFYQSKYNTLEDFFLLSRNKILQNGGYLLLSEYSNSIEKLLKSVFPNYPWPEISEFHYYDNLNEVNHFSVTELKESIDKQRKLMSFLERKFNLKTKEDWLLVPRSTLDRFRASQKLLSIYNYNMKVLLTTIFPNQKWDFKSLKFRPVVNYFHSPEFQTHKLLFFLRQYKVEKQNDWYRLPIKLDELRLYRTLKLLFPDHIWNEKEFQFRSKRINQRLLFVSLQQLFQNHFIIEDYKHPKLFFTSDISLEFDIFIPSMYIAFEYQGEHHYNDIPSASSFAEIYIKRDQFKEQLSTKHYIEIFHIPYWWDQTLPSLLSTIRSQSTKIIPHL